MSNDPTGMSELREYYDHTDQAAALAEATHEIATGPVLVSTPIRLPKALMDAVRVRATAAGIPATALMRGWITARIEAENSSAQLRIASATLLAARACGRASRSWGAAPAGGCW